MRPVYPIGAVAAAAILGGAYALAQELSFSQIERGRYLVTVGNCIVCHTDMENNGVEWAGGRELDTPFGVIITPNLTFDETGIGGWSRDDFWRVLHEGVRPDGAQIYPAMPYPYFTRMPREDVDAIYDYLSTLPPVRAEHVPEEELPAPLRVREAVRAWKLLNFDQGVFEPDPNQSEAWNRGAYLVNGPAHCGACHTGKNLTGGDNPDEFLRGGVLENWLAPNIRGGANGGLEAWSEEEIVEFLSSGRTEHTIAMERMGEVVVYSTQHMEEDDLHAVATYLKSLDDEPREAAEEPDEERMVAGENIFFDNCAACHRSDGSGASYVYAELDGSNKVLADDPTTVIRLVLEGARSAPTETYPGPVAMPSFAWKLNDEQIADLVTYLRGAWGNTAPPVSAAEVAELRETLGLQRD